MKGALALLMALWAAPVLAQKLDCRMPVTQQDINQCAYQDYLVADDALNRSYRAAIARARDLEQYVSADVEQSLRAAQRAWIAFRDLACAVEGMPNEGGSMQPMIVSGCLTRLTWARQQDLDLFGGEG